MKPRNLFILLITITALTNSTPVKSQTLSLTDLLNLQKCDWEKAKGFFTYKGFTWNSSEKNKPNFEIGGYTLYNDVVQWKNNSETVQYLSAYGHETILIYYPDSYAFTNYEKETQNTFKLASSQTKENLLSTSYTNQNIRITFNAKKRKDYYSTSTYYEIIIDNKADIDKRLKELCNNCKGKGQITEYQKCSSCNGNGRQKCYTCSGNGNLVCSYCKSGYNNCSSCWGKGTQQCTKCYGQGTLQCSKCYGQGEYSCQQCYGSGSIQQNIYVGVINVPCPSCGGKGKISCANCSGKGSYTCSSCSGSGNKTCNSCSGSGKKTCSYCKGNFAQTCTQCNGSGYTNLVCNYCNGKGTSNNEIKKICPICNGTGQNTNTIK